jgi:putative PEP-CTERM system TPR-repeat lipoprotein
MTRKVRLAAITALTAVALAACSNGDAEKRRHLEQGNRFFDQKKYAEAILEYRNALQIDDRFGEARARLGEAFAATGNPEGAYRQYQRAADLMPDDMAVQKRAATLLFMAGQFQDVRSRVEVVLRNNPRDIDAQLLMANAMVGLRDLEGGVREIEEAIQIDPEHAATYTNLALLKLAQGKSDAAREAFEKAVALDPKSTKARLALTYFFLATGNAAMAEQQLDTALEMDPRDPLANRALAALYIGTGRAALAEKPLQLVAEVTGRAQAKFALSEYYERSGRPKDARLVLEPMLKSDATYPDAQTRLAGLTYAAGDRELAKRQIDEVLAKFPNHPLALQAKARWYLADGKPAQALDRAKAAVAVAPRDVGALYLLGTLQAVNGQREAAATSFNQVLRFNPRVAAAQVQLAQLSLTRGDNEGAAMLAREALVTAPGVPEARLQLARALVAQRDYAAAESEINSLLARYPRAPAGLSLKGTLFLLKGDEKVAREAFQRAFDLAPGSISALTGLSMLDVRQKKVAAARARVDARVAAEPARPAVLIVAAKVYVADQDLVSAERVLRQSLKLAPSSPDVYNLLIEIYRTQKRLDAAKAEFDAEVRVDGTNVAARTMAAALAHAQNDQKDAKRRYRELLAIQPRAVIAANNLAWIYAEERQNLDVALELAERASEQLPDYADAWDTLGWVYYRKQLPLLAIAPFEKAVSQEPENATFHYHLGMALAGVGDHAKAKESLQTALKLQPSYADALREMKALPQ